MDNIIGKVKINKELNAPELSNIYIRYKDGRFIYYNTNYNRYPNYPLDIKYFTTSDRDDVYQEVRRIEREFKRDLKLKQLLS